MVKMELFKAVWSGLSLETEKLLYQGAHPDSRDSKGNTPLLVACHCGHNNIVRILINYGASLDAVNHRGETCIHMAIGNVRIMKRIVSNVQLSDDILFHAIRHKDSMSLLLAHRANVNAVDSVGYTPIYYAALRGDDDAVRRLIEFGANLRHRDKKGRTIAHILVSRKKVDMLILEKILNECNLINEEDDDSYTVYFTAIKHSTVYVVDFLSKYCPQTYFEGKYDSLGVAIVNRRHDMLYYLLSENADPNIKYPEFHNRTPCHVAVAMDDIISVELLIRYGADLSQEDGQGFDVAYFCSLCPEISMGMVSYLLSKTM